jgi:tRNA-(ms[2]io[6]A)-hydroxylase
LLHLKLPTDPRWANIAERNIEEILTDHAYCEQKATSSCISLIIQYPNLTELVDIVTPIVSEEWKHFEMVMMHLRKRGYELGKPRKDEYVVELQRKLLKGGSKEQQLTEKLLLNALIEARSCERFKTLWQNIEDKELSEFYHKLMKSEARHYVTFIELARKYAPREKVDKRWQELLEIEAEILKNIGVRGDRMH